MPGRTPQSYRLGNLAEDLGILLLKGLAAVAEVARPEDVGLDAIATLLRPEGDGNLYAEDSFLVQLKSDSTSTLDYEGHELAWLTEHSLPMFIGLVSLRESKIALYSTVFVNQAVANLEPKRVTLQFGVNDAVAKHEGQNYCPWSGNGRSEATVWLGHPVLEWQLKDIRDQDWRMRTYEAMKCFLSQARTVLEAVSIRTFPRLVWSTNDLQSIQLRSWMMKGDPGELQNLVSNAERLLRVMMLSATAAPEPVASKLVESLKSLTSTFQECGLAFDEEGTMRGLDTVHQFTLSMDRRQGRIPG